MAVVDPSTATALVVAAGICGIIFAIWQFYIVSQISLGQGAVAVNLSGDGEGDKVALTPDSSQATGTEWWAHIEDGAATQQRMIGIYDAIRDGANAFLFAEYKICAIFIVVFGTLILILTSFEAHSWNWTRGVFTTIAFVVGGCTSIVSGYLGMSVAVFSNARTTIAACNQDEAKAWKGAFNTAFRGGAVMGFFLTSLALLVAYLLVELFKLQYSFEGPTTDANGNKVVSESTKLLFETFSGYGLGGSSIAMFGRVGGGIYTKAADVGADLAGKVVEDIPEDDPRNPATIADNVGDNVGDVAGMGSDLFGSFAEGTCAAFVIASSSAELSESWSSVMYPLIISAVGILVCIVTSFFATDFFPCKKESDVENVLKVQLAVSTILMTAVLYPVSTAFLPEEFYIGYCNGSLGQAAGSCYKGSPARAFGSVAVGLWAGCIIGFITEYYTSASYSPTREVARSCRTGAATNVIYGLALGYKSNIIPITLIAIALLVSFTLCGVFGVALAALGMLATLATCLTIDVYGPVCDNAGGIAEMSECPSYVREKTDALDAAGNTTAAIGKGFAIGSAALVAVALFGAFVTRCDMEKEGIDILQPIVFSWMLIGAMIPYWFTAMTMKSVGNAAMEMVEEVKRQFATIPGLLEGLPGHDPPDHAKCIKISTDASLKEMIAPGLLVMLSPIICGIFFGTQAVCGLLAGSITSGVQLAISQSNTGGAWDNAKKYVEGGNVSQEINGEMVVQGKGSQVHKAAVIGDTVGDPLKDTSGPAINIVMKLQAIISLVFATLFMAINDGHGVFNIVRDPNFLPAK